MGTIIFIMNERIHKIRRKKAELIARNVIHLIASLELIEFENENSDWIKKFGMLLNQFHKFDSKPVDSISCESSREDHIEWIQNGFDFLANTDQWLIVVPNCDEPIWANVRVTGFEKAITSIWDVSESNEFVLANKTSCQIGAIFFEEKSYDLHKMKIESTKPLPDT